MIRLTAGAQDAGARLDKLVAAMLGGVGRSVTKRVFSEGRVLVEARDGRKRRGRKGDVVVDGDRIEVDIDLEALAPDARPEPDAPLRVVLETDDLVVVDKPAGQPTAPLRPGETGTLANALLGRFPEMAGVGYEPREPGLCHRLDTNTSGLLLAARHDDAFQRLTRALKSAKLRKRYLLLCAPGLPDSGVIELPVAPHPRDRRRVVAEDVKGARSAKTRYRVLRRAPDAWLVEASAARARRHQVRVHFAALGHPLLADELYGAPKHPRLSRHALHASEIAFKGDASTPAFEAQAPLPADLQALIE